MVCVEVSWEGGDVEVGFVGSKGHLPEKTSGIKRRPMAGICYNTLCALNRKINWKHILVLHVLDIIF